MRVPCKERAPRFQRCRYQPQQLQPQAQSIPGQVGPQVQSLPQACSPLRCVGQASSGVHTAFTMWQVQLLSPIFT